MARESAKGRGEKETEEEAQPQQRLPSSRVIGEARPVSLAFVKNTLQKREKEGELHYEQKLALEYARKFSRLDQKTSEEVGEELMKLEIPRFKARHAVKIADIMPEDKTALKAIFSKESITLNNEQIEQVLKILGKYRSQVAQPKELKEPKNRRKSN